MDFLYSNVTFAMVRQSRKTFTKTDSMLPKGGQMALQMTHNFGSQLHTVMREVVESGQWVERLKPVLRSHQL